ncbi:Site-specific recombinase [Alloactinosynnema sp. L-07]|nr:Site-specific recombinase [Alloactinosynnema sp. L-07]
MARQDIRKGERGRDREGFRRLSGRRERTGDRESAKARLADAEARLRRFQEAFAAGIDPMAVMEPMNQAEAERVSARAELDNAPAPTLITAAEVHSMIDSLGDVASALSGTDLDALADLYRSAQLELRYENAEEAAYVAASVRVNSECPRTDLRTNHNSESDLMIKGTCPSEFRLGHQRAGCRTSAHSS